MKIIKTETEKMYYFDCDDTLVMWDRFDHPNAIRIELSPNEGFIENLVPHEKHIELLKLRKSQGDTIVVWSAGGWRWALSVVKALGIEDYVDLVIPKPFIVIDDLAVSEMHRRVYYEFKDEVSGR